MTDAHNILVVTEYAGAGVPATTLELLTLARRLSSQTDKIAVVLVGDRAHEPWRALEMHGADRLLFAQRIEDASVPVAQARLAAISAACERIRPAVVLLEHDAVGAELAPRLAFRLDGAAATGCVDVGLEAGTVRCTRPCYGGLAREVNEYVHTPVFATIRCGVFEPASPTDGARRSVEDLGAVAPAPTSVRVLERLSEAAEGVRLDDARVIVAGGRGLGGPEGFAALKALAAELGAAVGASRVPCDLGWCPHSWQIGLTGKTVTPELYVAVGISGAGHHMAGCGNAKTIVAINSDAEAAIFQDAHFGIVGDYREIVPALAGEIRNLKQAT
jgi:electron transfer flavoprotein alpha subunit